MKKTIYFFLIILTMFFIYNIIKPQQKYTYIKPTKDFYIYDQNNLLLTSTKYQIYQNSKNLYDISLTDKDIDQKIKGIQVVVLALKDNNSLDTTIVMNEWKIGKNDMGLLLTFYFNDEDEIPSLSGYGYEAGYQMESYFTAVNYENLVNNNLFPYSNEVNIIKLYYEVLSFIYLNIYNYDEFIYDLDDYIDSMYDSSYSLLPSSQIDFFQYLSVPLWLNLTIYIVFGTFFSSSLFVINKGGGGKSRGYKYRK